ncbi:uncharacterized protein LOC116257887 isoform X2 [Nymphaea colorata]|nr:uncharacterized protein LOC116257887 isoform X2 [Nymphaea colorata]
MVPATTSYWRAIISRIQGKLSWGRGTTAPQMSTYASPAHRVSLLHKLETGLKHMNGEFTPVAAAFGMILLAASLGLYTARHQLLYAPNVSVDKRRRETIPEVKEPDDVAQTSYAFFSNSFFRRLAHLQGPRRGQVLPHPIRGDPFS